MTTNAEVDAWMAEYDNPMKPVVQAMREIILAADDRVGECIKWKAPTFTYKGNIASFFPKSKKHASLMFHMGAHIPGDHAILQGDAKDGRSVKIATLEDLTAQRAALEQAVRAWCDWKDRA
ncbi:MAG: DUF1801 domain-containing protein [Pseudomonadota bacterium]